MGSERGAAEVPLGGDHVVGRFHQECVGDEGGESPLPVRRIPQEGDRAHPRGPEEDDQAARSDRREGVGRVRKLGEVISGDSTHDRPAP